MYVQNQNSLLVKRQNDNTSPGLGRGRLVPSSHKGRDAYVRHFSRGDERIREDIPVPDSLGGKEAFLIGFFASRGNLRGTHFGKQLLHDIIYNKSLQTGNVPDDWKKANVSAVLNKGQRYDPANYLPVSLTCLCCKIFEYIIVSSVMKHVYAYSILTDCQHGFRARRSCETQLVTLTHDLASYLDSGIQTNMVGLDFSKAFDRVPHQRLMRKLHH